MARIRKHQDVRLKFLSTNISRAKGRKDGKEITLTPEEAFAIVVEMYSELFDRGDMGCFS